MFNKFKENLQEKIKTTGLVPQGNQPKQQQQVPSTSAPPQETVTFSLQNMDQFSHEELQSVIHRYDGQIKKLKTLIAERDTKYNQLKEEAHQNEEMLSLRTDEISGLKLHLQTFHTENTSLKRLVDVLQSDAQENEDLESQNEQFAAQISDLRKLNQELSQGDAVIVYQQQYQEISATCEMMRIENIQLKSDCQLLKQSVEHSNERLAQVSKESEEIELSLNQSQALITKKDKLIEQLKVRQQQLLEDKQVLTDQNTVITDRLKQFEDQQRNLGLSNEKVITENSERIRGKDLVIEDLNNQVKQLNVRIQSQNEKETYYKRQIETLKQQCQELQQQNSVLAAKTLADQVSRMRVTSNDEKQEGDEGVHQLLGQLQAIQSESNSTPEKSNACHICGQSSDQQKKIVDFQISPNTTLDDSKEVMTIRHELTESQVIVAKLSSDNDELSETNQKFQSQNEELSQELVKLRQLVQELERRREQAKKEIKHLIQKGNKIEVQSDGLLQLRLLKKDLQQFYKELLTGKDSQSLEKQINDMIFNINDFISEVELSVN